MNGNNIIYRNKKEDKNIEQKSFKSKLFLIKDNIIYLLKYYSTP